MKKGKEKIFIFGASGHAKVLIDVVERQGLYEIAFLVDDDSTLKDSIFFGYRVIGGRSEMLLRNVAKGIVAIGNNFARRSVAAWLQDHTYELVSAIHPSAQIGRGSRVGPGTVIMAGAVINTDVIVGENVIVNTKAGIDHDCSIGSGAHIAPGSVLCGTVTVGEDTFVCAGATVIPNISIGRAVIVGAGATVVHDVPDNVTVVGTPARIVKYHLPCMGLSK
jgi:sugar O-acyltransferase (sialic acid O-acetyltransferase NeuD family)